MTNAPPPADNDAATKTSAPADPAATWTMGAGPAEGLPPPEVVGRFRVLGQLARGGMGVVYRALDPQFDREVAVKVLAGRMSDRPDAVRRFLDEARITGQLQHPSVIPVHESGTLPDGRPFLVMKLIKGRTLEDLLKERDNPAADCGRLLAVFEQVCQAVAYAHAHKVIHRDLKPANVMVGAFGEVQVMDWGLAKVLGAGPAAEPTAARNPELTEIRTTRDSESYTQAGSLLGTPAYMPPEQAAGAVEQTDERADVFGLGAALCAVLTGQPPYIGATAEAVRVMAVRGKVDEAFGRLDRCGADPELVALCKRCLAPEPADRPADARAVATAVSGLRAAAEDRARRAEVDRTAAEVRAAEQSKRRRVQAALGLAFTALVVVGGAFAWWAQEQKRARREQAEREVNRAVEAAVARYAQARGAGRDLALWAEARASALQARDRAAAAGAPPEVRDRVGDLLAEIEQVERNRRLVATLLEVQASMADDPTPDGNQDFAGADARYARAFGEYGTDLFQLSPEAGADLLRGLGGDVRIELAAALDDWAYVRFVLTRMGKAADGPARLFGVTRLLDPDVLRNQIRDLAVAGNYAGLAQVAEGMDPAAQPVQTVNLVAVYLYWSNLREGPGAASRFLKRAYPYHPGGVQINLNLAFFLQREGRYAESLPYCAAAIALRPRSAGVMHNYAVALAGLQRNAEAATVYHRICTLAPAATFALRRLIELSSRAGDRKATAAVLGELADRYREALRRDPANPAIHHNLGATLFELDDLNGAIAAYAEAVRLGPWSDMTQGELWTALMKQQARAGVTGDPAVLACFAEMTRTAPKDAWPHSHLGNLLRAKGDRPGAIARYRDAIRVDPNYVWAYRFLGDMLLEDRDFDGAADCFREVARLQPNNTWPHTKLGLALAGKGDWDGAIANYDRALRVDARYSSAHRHKGDALVGKGQPAAALAAYATAVELDPNDPWAHNSLAWLLATGPDGVRDGKRAVTHAARACALTAWRTPSFIGTLAAAHAEAGDFDKAIEFQNRALASSPDVPKAGLAARERLAQYERKRPYRDWVFFPRETGPPPRVVK